MLQNRRFAYPLLMVYDIQLDATSGSQVSLLVTVWILQISVVLTGWSGCCFRECYSIWDSAKEFGGELLLMVKWKRACVWCWYSFLFFFSPKKYQIGFVSIVCFLYWVAESLGQTSFGPCRSYNWDFQCSRLHKRGKATGIKGICNWGITVYLLLGDVWISYLLGKKSVEENMRVKKKTEEKFKLFSRKLVWNLLFI